MCGAAGAYVVATPLPLIRICGAARGTLFILILSPSLRWLSNSVGESVALDIGM